MASNALSILDDDKQTQLARMNEFNVDASIARAQKEVEAAIAIAKRFPRNEDEAFQKLMRSCQRFTFAERAEYRYQRGSKLNPETNKWEPNFVNGPSVYLAREAARIWGNLIYGTEIMNDGDTERTIRSFAWDLETNVRKFSDTTFKKLIQRKPKDNKGKIIDGAKAEWVRPDERDLRELHNKQEAICERNALLKILRDDLIMDAKITARDTIMAGIKKDPEAQRKRILAGFMQINVSVKELEEYLGHSVASASPEELGDLRQIWSAIAEGEATWSEYMEARADELMATRISAADKIAFFKAYKDSGFTTLQMVEFLKRDFNIDDARLALPEMLPRMMQWAKRETLTETGGMVTADKTETKPQNPETKTADTKTEPAKAETKEADTLFDTPPLTEEEVGVMKIIDQLFGILQIPESDQKIYLKKFKGNLKELRDSLESQLPPD